MSKAAEARRSALLATPWIQDLEMPAWEIARRAFGWRGSMWEAHSFFERSYERYVCRAMAGRVIRIDGAR